MKKLFIIFIYIYRAFSGALHQFSWMFGFPGGCRYQESCSHYSERMLNEQKLGRASLLIIKRLLSCGPWNIKKAPWTEKQF